MMQINIQSPGIKLNQKLNGFVQEKLKNCSIITAS